MIKTIRLGKVDHPVRLSNGAFTIFQEKTDLDPFVILSNGKELRKPKNMQALIYGGIKMGYLWNNEPCPLSFDQVGNLMDIRSLDKYMMAALESIPVDDEIEVDEKKNMTKAS